MEGLTGKTEKYEKAERRRERKEEPRAGGKLWEKKNNTNNGEKETEDSLKKGQRKQALAVNLEEEKQHK